MRIPILRKRNQFSAPSELDALSMVRLAVISAIGAIMAVTLVFLYRDFYQTIVQARVVIVLKQEVALENIDLALFRAVRAVHEYKVTSIIREPIADPFDTRPIPPTPQDAPARGEPSAQP